MLCTYVNLRFILLFQDEEKHEVAAELITDEKMMKSPDFSSHLSDNSDLMKQAIHCQANKVIVENHAVTANVGNTFIPDSANNTGNRNLKLNDLEAELSESSSSQSLPVISIKDTESNLPSCKYIMFSFLRISSFPI